MGFTVELQCPQCGGAIELDETDHILSCSYCNINNYLYAHNYLRFALPHKAPGKDIIYAPYLRFRGKVFYCQGFTIGHRVIDITSAGLPLKGLPNSLGLRPQAMKMKFVTQETPGSFLKFTLKASTLVSKAASLSSSGTKGNLYHRAYIGETLSIIYLPLYIEGNRLFDAVLNEPVSDFSCMEKSFSKNIIRKPAWKYNFIPTICSKCGWNLECERDSVVLICKNCDTAWDVQKGKFSEVNLMAVSGKTDSVRYLPFWRISATANGIELGSYADFIRITNQPIIIDKAWEKLKMSFWIPGFKIRPKTFLRISKQLTIAQRFFVPDTTIPKKNLYPATLPCTEAIQSIKITIANAAVNKKMIISELPNLRFKIQKSTLIYLPFTDTGHEFMLQDSEISINKRALEFGRGL